MPTFAAAWLISLNQTPAHGGLLPACLQPTKRRLIKFFFCALKQARGNVCCLVCVVCKIRRLCVCVAASTCVFVFCRFFSSVQGTLRFNDRRIISQFPECLSPCAGLKFTTTFRFFKTFDVVQNLSNSDGLQTRHAGPGATCTPRVLAANMAGDRSQKSTMNVATSLAGLGTIGAEVGADLRHTGGICPKDLAPLAQWKLSVGTLQG